MNPQNTEDWYKKGNKLFDKGEYQEAITCYDKAIEMDPNNVEAWNNKIFALFCLGKYTEADICCDAALEKHPKNAKIWISKATVLKKAFDKDMLKPLWCLSESLEIDPGNAEVWYRKGQILEEVGMSGESLSCYEKAININPNYAVAWNNKGLILENKQQYEKAIASYEKAMEIDQQELTSAKDNKERCVKILNELGEVWLEKQKKEEKENKAVLEKLLRWQQAQRRREQFMKPLKDWIEKQKHKRMLYIDGYWYWEKQLWHPGSFIKLGMTAKAKRLIEAHPEYINENITGFTLLHTAAIYDNREIAEFLLNKGANINQLDDLHRTALYHAVENKHKEMVELLLSYEALPNIADTDGWTPLHKLAIFETEEKIEITKLLLEYGANINIKAKCGCTPLNVAIESQSYKIGKLLLEAERTQI